MDSSLTSRLRYEASPNENEALQLTFNPLRGLSAAELSRNPGMRELPFGLSRRFATDDA
jgi:hypothetical protein